MIKITISVGTGEKVISTDTRYLNDIDDVPNDLDCKAIRDLLDESNWE